ncbi:uncharacterized mitochondrial protein AtMg00810-like [Arachis stenosperma]|uniref:uncharacterized mitochondrial protein AtMg00810-like n=1 Tax=Arachis stenosperma TaxID=217475 RepID=UPI0025ABA0F5|nr:uncharacterized mitochondrial protein AtMg00810-like [Arachis stenosperma]
MELPLDHPQRKEGLVCKLTRSLYGLRQASRQWFTKFCTTLLSHGFTQCKQDYSLFALGEGDATTFLIVYVDDIIIAAPKQEMVDNVKLKLQSIFKLKILGDLKFFLGLELAHSKAGIALTKRKYALSLLEETGYLGCKPATTPMDANMKLRADEDDPVPDPSHYRRLIGRLMYLTISRPDITFAVVKLAQFMSGPRLPHLNATHQVIRYLKAASGQGLLFSSKSKFNLTMYTDADWGGCLDTRRSTTGYCTFLGDSLILWKSKKQDVVSRSSTEAEYRALANAACEVLSLMALLKFMHIEVHSAMVFCDNISAIQMSTNPTLHERSKHIKIDYHFIREKVASGIIKLVHVPSKHQLADILTKALPAPQFQYLMAKLGTYNMYAPT